MEEEKDKVRNKFEVISAYVKFLYPLAFFLGVTTFTWDAHPRWKEFGFSVGRDKGSPRNGNLFSLTEPRALRPSCPAWAPPCSASSQLLPALTPLLPEPALAQDLLFCCCQSSTLGQISWKLESYKTPWGFLKICLLRKQRILILLPWFNMLPPSACSWICFYIYSNQYL